MFLTDALKIVNLTQVLPLKVITEKKIEFRRDRVHITIKNNRISTEH